MFRRTLCHNENPVGTAVTQLGRNHHLQGTRLVHRDDLRLCTCAVIRLEKNADRILVRVVPLNLEPETVYCQNVADGRRLVDEAGRLVDGLADMAVALVNAVKVNTDVLSIEAQL